jgi:hypothetical protein
MSETETFEIEMEIKKAILPNGAYRGTIDKYEIKQSNGGKKYIQVYVDCMTQCYPARINVSINNKNPQLSVLIQTLGWSENGHFSGTFDPKKLVGQNVLVQVIKGGNTYNGGDLQQFIYEFEYKSLHGIQPQAYSDGVSQTKKQPKKENLRKTFEKMKKAVEVEDSRKESNKRYEFSYPNFKTNDSFPLPATYRRPHPSKFSKGEYAEEQDRYGNKYWVEIPF